MTETRLQYITGKTGGAISAVESQINTILKYSITSNELIDLERPITNSHPHTNIITIDRPDSSQVKYAAYLFLLKHKNFFYFSWLIYMSMYLQEQLGKTDRILHIMKQWTRRFRVVSSGK